MGISISTGFLCQIRSCRLGDSELRHSSSREVISLCRAMGLRKVSLTECQSTSHHQRIQALSHCRASPFRQLCRRTNSRRVLQQKHRQIQRFCFAFQSQVLVFLWGAWSWQWQRFALWNTYRIFSLRDLGHQPLLCDSLKYNDARKPCWRPTLATLLGLARICRLFLPQ